MTRVLKPLDTAKTYLVTGAAGFIGFHLSKRLLDEGCNVLGLDNLNDYYDVNLKKARLAILKNTRNSHSYLRTWRTESLSRGFLTNILFISLLI